MKRILLLGLFFAVLGAQDIILALNPPGSYLGSCRGCRVHKEHNELFCSSCKVGGGISSERDVTLENLSDCKAPISNCNGELRCGDC